MKNNNRKAERAVQEGIGALLAALLAGGTLWPVAGALGVEKAAWIAFLPAVWMTLTLFMLRREKGWKFLGIALLLGSVLLWGYRWGRPVLEMTGRIRNGTIDRTEYREPIRALILLVSGLLALLYSGMTDYGTGGILLFGLVPVSVGIAYTLESRVPVYLFLPLLAGGILLLGVKRTEHSLRRALACLAVTLVLTGCGLKVLPRERFTWDLLEAAAQKIRELTDDYFFFTEERIAFSIQEMGFDRVVQTDAGAERRLGGEANPSDTPVMTVKTRRNLHLRGTVKRTYTGNAWVDDQSKSRYLYYDLLRESTRGRVFDAGNAAGSEGYSEVEAQVEFLNYGTSTLFVPDHMADFSMSLGSAVYFNTAGEIFLTRSTQPGDTYSFTAWMPDDREALLAAAARLAGARDAEYEPVRENYTELPDCVGPEVYRLAAQIAAGLETPAEIACAVEDYLSGHYTYTLRAGVPASGEDFVTWFLFEEKKGYCSYFASAMTVLLRTLGIPARYVEGYYVRADAEETRVTGRNAHAWTEVYFNGLGWCMFDPTASAYALQTGRSEEDFETFASAENPPEEGEDPVLPGTTREPENGRAQEDSGEDGTPEETEKPRENSGAPGTENPPLPEENGPEPPENGKGPGSFFWIPLILLLLGAAVILRAYFQSPKRLAARAKDNEAECMVWYRACLTALAREGMMPNRGETPGAFAHRVTQSAGKEDSVFEDFVLRVLECVYGEKEFGTDLCDRGNAALESIVRGMPARVRLGYEWTLFRRGIGDTARIP